MKCKEGFWGRRCKLCGRGCKRTSDIWCNTDQIGSCDFETGRCECISGWRGERCDEQCTDKNCAMCRDRADQCELCKNYPWGWPTYLNCNERCPENCKLCDKWGKCITSLVEECLKKCSSDCAKDCKSDWCFYSCRKKSCKCSEFDMDSIFVPWFQIWENLFCWNRENPHITVTWLLKNRHGFARTW